MKNVGLYQVSKQNLLSKELQYIKSNPISEELKSFINRYKRKAGYPFQKREKELDKEHMYVVKDGDIVPLNEMEAKETEIVPPPTEDDEKFTVIPLIVPITVSRDRNATATCTEEEIIIPVTKSTEETTTFRIFREPIRRVHVTTTEKADETEEERETPSASVNPKLLNRVFQDIKQLITDQEIPKGAESAVCSVNGDWDSVAGGKQIRISTQNDTHHPEAYLVDREPPMEEGFFKEGNWTISALVPYLKASILVLNAHTIKGKKYVAVFIGECKICEQEESISGHWLIERQSKDCSDRQVSHKFISDVLKKNNVRHLQQQHLNSLVTVPSVPTIL